MKSGYSAVKRALDVVVASLGLVVLAPVMLATTIAVLIALGRPVFFVQQRPGLWGKPFRLIKFRTMLNPDPSHASANSDAARLTSFGRFLRKTSLDELPSLWNVVVGDMSVVGPRPLAMEYLPRYNAEQARRHKVRPGITGWAQVNGRNSVDWKRRLELDVWYVDHRSLALDAVIVLRTVTSVLFQRGISREGHATMPAFTGGSEDET